MSETEMQQLGQLTTEQEDELAEIQAEEVEFAVTLYECDGENSAAYFDRFLDVREEYEQEFVDTNRNQLEELRTQPSG